MSFFFVVVRGEKRGWHSLPRATCHPFEVRRSLNLIFLVPLPQSTVVTERGPLMRQSRVIYEAASGFVPTEVTRQPRLVLAPDTCTKLR